MGLGYHGHNDVNEGGIQNYLELAFLGSTVSIINPKTVISESNNLIWAEDRGLRSC